jgi:mono/diheme cytochrome c family protein
MNFKKILISFGSIFALSATAWAFPWDIDLVDAVFYRGYEWHMGTPPEGSVSQNHYRPFNYDDETLAESNGDNRISMAIYYSANTDKLVSPFPQANEMVLENGEQRFNDYCQTCHGVKGSVKTEDEKDWEVSKRWAQPIPALSAVDKSGKIALTGGNKPEGMLYLYIKNGFGRMPAYGHAMSDEEIWQVVHYIQSLNGQSFND